jgi:drug/metabolite transporter (DMT)-like permease
MDPAALAATRRRWRAIALMLLCVGVFSLMDAGLKTLSAHYPPFQVAALRGASSLPWLLAWALLSTGMAPLLRVRWSLHLLRGVLGITMMAAFVYALRTLPLSTASPTPTSAPAGKSAPAAASARCTTGAKRPRAASTIAAR